MALIECDTDHPVFNGLLLHSLRGAKMEQNNLLFLPFLNPIQTRSSGPLQTRIPCERARSVAIFEHVPFARLLLRTRLRWGYMNTCLNHSIHENHHRAITELSRRQAV